MGHPSCAGLFGCGFVRGPINIKSGIAPSRNVSVERVFAVLGRAFSRYEGRFRGTPR